MRRAYEVFTNSFSQFFDPEDLNLGIQGTLTSNDFTTHGDGLIELNKMWKWAGSCIPSGDSTLPEDRQYLFSDRVMCFESAKWECRAQDSWLVAEPSEGDGELPNDLSEDDPVNMEGTFYRRYELSVTYDRYNQTARLWLRGYNQFDLPLNKNEMLEDVPEPYVGKSVTVERHPFTGHLNLTVHPCNQKEIVKSEKENFSDKNVLVNLLRMWSNVFPCINILEGF